MSPATGVTVADLNLDSSLAIVCLYHLLSNSMGPENVHEFPLVMMSKAFRESMKVFTADRFCSLTPSIMLSETATVI